MASTEVKGSGRLGFVQTAQMTENLDKTTSVTFVMHGEDHTLGNALRYIIMKDPDVDFCGYSVPHPTENRINLRIQTKGSPAAAAFTRGLSNLSDVCDHIQETFKDSVQKYKDRMMDIQ
ncbi:DNA-directed RNA polymerases I and III subunit RPAC2-like [Diadema setosum]|uniref:DNA-directed RNA polymerases I and III subunit RPAC2-like n=1 Tax=Diadema antillarum TaxID=105358 RepID=UPI003A8898D5